MSENAIMEHQKFLVLASYPQSLVNFRGPLIGEASKAGHDVVAVAPGLSREPAVLAALRALAASPRDVALERTGTNPLEDVLGLWGLLRLMRRERPKAVLAYTIKPVIWGTLAAWLARVPRRYALITGLGYTFVDDGSLKRRLLNLMVRWLYRLALRHATKVFFQNPDDAALFAEMRLLPPALPRVVVNGSGVDLNHYAQAPLPPGPVRFLLITRLLGDKGVREYAQAAAMVLRDHPEARFDLVGFLDTNPNSVSAEELRGWQEAGTLYWHGPLDDVRPALAAAHVYVLPSYYREGTPRTVLEAMAMGRAVITTDTPGCRETVIDGHNGFMVPPRKAEPLAHAMRRFIEDPFLIEQMGAASRSFAEYRYDVRKVNAILLSEMQLIHRVPPNSE